MLVGQIETKASFVVAVLRKQKADHVNATGVMDGKA
jgi:hypothetical protein